MDGMSLESLAIDAGTRNDRCNYDPTRPGDFWQATPEADGSRPTVYSRLDSQSLRGLIVAFGEGLATSAAVRYW